MDSVTTDEETQRVNTFYDELAQFAKDKAVTVNIISIPGEDCNLDNLSKLSLATEGETEIVEPLKLMENFSNILDKQLIAM